MEGEMCSENGIAAKFEDMFWMTYFKLYKHEEGPN